ncbi:hypothetical protein HKX48_003282 [Thoreauomyces humboldtii]|nr:hypothetical protein HKX48_003282 [Thoreauomyces humboldtii]
MRFIGAVLAVLALSQTVLAQNATCTHPKVRREFRELSDTDKQNFINAVQCLRDPSRSPSFQPNTGSRTIYDDLVWVHRQNAPQSHTVAAFLPWHRGFLSLVEFWLDSNCGWSGGIPYWDWSLDSQVPQNSAILSSRWFGGNGNPGQQNCLSNGQFVNDRTVFTNPGTSNCIHRFFNVNNAPALGPTLINSVAQQTLMQNSRSSYAAFRNNFESQPHNGVHTSLGGDMYIVAISPNDPLFWLHHSNIDRLWDVWQKTNPSLAQTYNDFQKAVTVNDPLQYNIAWGNTAVVRWFLSTTSGGTMCYTYSNGIAPRALQFNPAAATASPSANLAAAVAPSSETPQLRPIDPISDSALRHLNKTTTEIKNIRQIETLMNHVTNFANQQGFVSHDLHTGTTDDDQWRTVSDHEVEVRNRMLDLLAEAALTEPTPGSAPATKAKMDTVKMLSKAWTLV